MTGRLYQQFAVTIAFSVILSAFNALILSPALLLSSSLLTAALEFRKGGTQQNRSNHAYRR